MNIGIIGGAGFIGTNLALELSKDSNNQIIVIDKEQSYFNTLRSKKIPNISFLCAPFSFEADFNKQINNMDIVYHLASTNIPGTSNQKIPEELQANVFTTAKLLDACVRNEIKEVIFLSSGGAVYGQLNICPISEDNVNFPITSYGVQKLTIEKLFYLYYFQFGLDYRIIRLANPYGPYQRPNGKLGVVTTFVYKALTDGKLNVFGDGKIVRDFIYIQDAIKGILQISNKESEFKLYNLGSGKGASVNEVINTIKKVIRNDIDIIYNSTNRSTDVKENYLDISRYESQFGKLNPITLEQGILKTADFLKKEIKKGIL